MLIFHPLAGCRAVGLVVLLALVAVPVARADADTESVVLPSAATAARIAAIEELVVERMAALDVPGVSVALTEGGHIVYSNGFGTANRAGHAMTDSTPSGIGSVSKSFTAAAVMQLVDEGRVQLDAAIASYLVELQTPADARVAQISVRQLLNHTSGFATYDGNVGQADYSQRADALDRAVSRLAGVALEAAPGERFQYSNANYQILGLLLERMDDRSFEEVIQLRVLDRLGLQESFVRTPPDSVRQPAEPFRYWLHIPAYFAKPTPRTIVAQGGVVASAKDMARYLLDLLSDAPRLLSVPARDELFRLADADAREGYALGWMVEQEDQRTLIYHNGLNPGYEAVAGFARYQQDAGQEHLGVVVLANASSGFAFGNVAQITDGVKNIVFGRTEADLGSISAGWGQMALLILINLLLLGLVLSWLRRFLKSQVVAESSGRKLLGGLLATALLLGFAGFVRFAVPRLVDVPMPGLQAFAPDAALALNCAVVLAVAAAILRGLIMIKPAIADEGSAN